MEEARREYVVEQMRLSMIGLVYIAIQAGQIAGCSHEEIREMLINAVKEDPDIVVIASELQISKYLFKISSTTN